MRKWLFLSVLFVWGCGNDLDELVLTEIEEEIIGYKLPHDPIAWFPFNNNTEDESGNELHGILYEGEYSSCRNENEVSSLELDIDDNPGWGEENDRVEILYDPIMNVDNITISAWVNLNEKTGDFANRNHSIVSRWSLVFDGTPEDKLSYAFYINSNLNIEFAYSDNTRGETNLFTSEEVINYGEWVHVAVSIDNINTRLYLNGSLIKEEDTIENIQLPQTDINLILGERQQYNGYWYHLNGKLDDIGIWGRALTPCEINDLYIQ